MEKHTGQITYSITQQEYDVLLSALADGHDQIRHMRENRMTDAARVACDSTSQVTFSLLEKALEIFDVAPPSRINMINIESP